MFITSDSYNSIEIKSIHDHLDTTHFWTLDLQRQDWYLNKLVMLEQFDSPVLTVSILGEQIVLPADWNVLIYSPETSNVDTVQISDLTKSNFTLFLYDFSRSKVVEGTYKVVNYNSNSTVHVPSFNKSNMMCYPVKDRYWIMVAPTDTYNKYLKDGVTVGNFLY